MRRLLVVVVAAAVCAGCGHDEPPPPKAPIAHAVREWVKGVATGNLRQFCDWTFPGYDLPLKLDRRLGLPTPDVRPPPPPWSQRFLRRDCPRGVNEPAVTIPRLTVTAIRSIRIGPAVSDADGISRTARVVTREIVAEDPYAKPSIATHLLVRYRGEWKVVYGGD